MDAFICRKREENDQANILEFCSRHASDDPNEFTCARTDSTVVRKTDSSSHLRKSNVDNLIGPEMGHGIQERVKNLEDHLSIVKPVPKDFYARLKDIENRVLFLEGISPEYFNNVGPHQQPEDTAEQKQYKELLSQSLTSINSRIQELQSKLTSKK